MPVDVYQGHLAATRPAWKILPMIPAFGESIRLLLALHELFVRGQAQGPEASTLRQAMERPWYDMTDEEQGRVEQLSADLYTLGERIVDPPPQAARRVELERAVAAHDWEAVLVLLQDHPGSAAPAERVQPNLPHRDRQEAEAVVTLEAPSSADPVLPHGGSAGGCTKPGSVG